MNNHPRQTHMYVGNKETFVQLLGDPHTSFLHRFNLHSCILAMSTTLQQAKEYRSPHHLHHQKMWYLFLLLWLFNIVNYNNYIRKMTAWFKRYLMMSFFLQRCTMLFYDGDNLPPWRSSPPRPWTWWTFPWAPWTPVVRNCWVGKQHLGQMAFYRYRQPFVVFGIAKKLVVEVEDERCMQLILYQTMRNFPFVWIMNEKVKHDQSAFLVKSWLTNRCRSTDNSNVIQSTSSYIPIATNAHSILDVCFQVDILANNYTKNNTFNCQLFVDDPFERMVYVVHVCSCKLHPKNGTYNMLK